MGSEASHELDMRISFNFIDREMGRFWTKQLWDEVDEFLAHSLPTAYSTNSHYVCRLSFYFIEN